MGKRAMNDMELLSKWADYLSENPHEMQRLCDLIYALLAEELWYEQERSAAWSYRL